MAIEVRIPTILRTHTKGEKRVEATGSTLEEVIADLDTNHSGLRERLIKDGKLHIGAGTRHSAFEKPIDDGPLGRLLRAGRTGAAAEMLGVGGGAMDMTLGYLKERKQFGTVIGSYQALQHRAAHLYSEMEVARAAVLKAQQLLDAGDDRAEAAVSVAKAMTGIATTLAVQEGVQMHGGIGMTDEYDIGFYMKRGRVLAEMFGDANFHADQLARAAGY